MDFSFSDSVAFTYLGVSVKVRGRDFLCSQYQRIKMKADGYMHAILQTTKDSIDRALVVRSLWLFCAVPSIMYGAEACVLGKNIFKRKIHSKVFDSKNVFLYRRKCCEK